MMKHLSYFFSVNETNLISNEFGIFCFSNLSCFKSCLVYVLTLFVVFRKHAIINTFIKITPFITELLFKNIINNYSSHLYLCCVRLNFHLTLTLPPLLSELAISPYQESSLLRDITTFVCMWCYITASS